MNRYPRLAAAAAVIALPVLLASCSRTYSSGREFRNAVSFAALKADGSVVAWGSPSRGGDPDCVNNPVSCGPAPAGSLSSGVVNIFSSYGAYAALKSDGSLAVWGGPVYGGDITCAQGSGQCNPVAQSAISSGVRTVASTYQAFAATKTDGSVVAWGENDFGGNPSCAVAGCSPAPVGALSSGVAQVWGGYNAFAALKTDGSVVAWGDSTGGGDASAPVGGPLTGVTGVTPGGYAFSAIKAGGAVVTWGDPARGGDFTCAVAGCTAAPVGSLASGVISINTTNAAFAALKDDGTVVTWGSTPDGGSSASPVGGALTGVTAIAATDAAFAVIRNDGSVVTWGDGDYGGEPTCTPRVFCVPAPPGSLSSGVVSLVATRRAFAALKQDGSVVAWGAPLFGGDPSCVAGGGCTPAPAHALDSGVTQLMWSNDAFVARKADGSVVAWGSTPGGGDASAPVGGSLTGVAQVFTNNGSGAALTQSGGVVTWGQPDDGGDPACAPTSNCSPAPAGSLLSGVVYIASPFVGWPPAPVPPVTPPVPPADTGGGSAAPTVIPPLPGRTTCTHLRCTTTGPVPSGVTRVTQTATRTARAAERGARGEAMAISRVRGQCAIATASHTYACSVRLSPGRWAITTTALAASTVRAQSVKRVRIARAAAHQAVTG